MNPFGRRRFLKSSVLAPFIVKDLGHFNRKPVPPLSFSTLGCPGWTFDQVVSFAAANQYQGIELRGIKGQLNLPELSEFNSASAISETMRKMQDKHLRFVDLGSSTELHHTDAATRQKHLDDGKKFIDLAAKLNCPYVRVFPNKLPDSDERSKIIDLIIQGLIELGSYAGKSGVRVLMESHGDAVKTDELQKIMESASSSNTGLVWDVVNMWVVTKQPPTEVYSKLKNYIYHTHLKDLTIDGKNLHYVLIGTGVAPIFEAIDLLYKNGYKGFYSFEWEKLWHPEIAEPEIALADFPQKMRAHFNQL